MAELGILRGDDEVGHHGELAAAGEGVAVDLRDGDLGHVPEVHLDVGDLLHAGADAHHQAASARIDGLVAADHAVGAAAGGREVVAGAEGAAGAADDDDAAGVVGLVVVERSVELEKQLLGERVHLFRAVEGDAADAAVGTDAIEFEGFKRCHGCLRVWLNAGRLSSVRDGLSIWHRASESGSGCNISETPDRSFARVRPLPRPILGGTRAMARWDRK